MPQLELFPLLRRHIGRAVHGAAITEQHTGLARVLRQGIERVFQIHLQLEDLPLKVENVLLLEIPEEFRVNPPASLHPTTPRTGRTRRPFAAASRPLAPRRRGTRDPCAIIAVILIPIRIQSHLEVLYLPKEGRETVHGRGLAGTGAASEHELVNGRDIAVSVLEIAQHWRQTRRSV